MNKAGAFLRHRMRAVNLHGIHSPFVYGLTKDCIYSAEPRPAATVVECFKTLKNNTSAVEGVDFGRGGTHQSFRIKNRVGASVRDFQAMLLHRLVNYFQYKEVIELGTNVGKSAVYMGSGGANVLTVEGNHGLASFADQLMKQLDLSNRVQVVCDEFENYLSGITGRMFDMAFVDGNHTYEATVRYYQLLKPMIKDKGAIIFHDIYWSKEMQRAWNRVCNDPDATVTIDLYFMGLVFLKRPQAKEHFLIRFPKSVFDLVF